MKIFWSWQSDRGRNVCRDLIKKALVQVAERLTDQLGLDESERPDVDHDTEGEPGLVDIVSTILKKIDAAAVFVGDMTPIGKSDGGKLLPNPNVLLELGYAMKAIGPEKIVLVANTEWAGGPAQLPFDLRHRRAPITYRLARDADETARQAALEQLVAELTSAIGPMLAGSLEAKDANVNLGGRPARDGNPAVWFPDGQKLRHRDWFGEARETEISVEPAPYAYMRIIPAGWSKTPATRDQVHNVPDPLRLEPLGRYTGADGGMNAEGALTWRVVPGRQTPHTTSAAQWFLSGEIWGFDSNAVSDEGPQRTLATHYLLQRWARFLRRGMAMADHLGSAPLRRVELGAVELEDAKWPADLASERVASFESKVVVDATGRMWDAPKRLELITRAYNALRGAYGLPKTNEADVANIVGGEL